MSTKLKSYRLANRLTQNELAETLKIPVSTYQQYEQGTRRIPTEKLILFADFFHTSIDEIVGHSVKEFLSQSEQELLSAFRAVCLHDQKLVLSLLRTARQMQEEQNTARIAARSPENPPIRTTELSSQELQTLQQLDDIPEDI